MRRAMWTMLALVLSWTFVPGSMELLESAVHLARHGHGAHAEVAQHEHPEPDAEHGCTPAAHTCGCCRVFFEVTVAVPPLAPAERLVRRAARAVAPSPSEHVFGIDHPPRA